MSTVQNINPAIAAPGKAAWHGPRPSPGPHRARAAGATRVETAM